ncbi:MAG: hypothetical protein WC455_20120 [Dehalococcoidia bacterium]|jgi:hypothetical protein
MKAMHRYHNVTIKEAIAAHQTQSGGIYPNEIVMATGLNRKVVTAWLRENGYRKTGSDASKHWQKVVAVLA